MPRKIPTSGKHRRERLQLKRSIKRGDAPPEALAVTSRKKKKPNRGRASAATDKQSTTRKLQSSFTVKLSPEFLEETRVKSAILTLPRPIPEEKALFHDVSRGSDLGSLSIMGRPKWNYDMTKVQLESNEEALFKKWVEDTDKTLGEWVKAQNAPEKTADAQQDDGDAPNPEPKPEPEVDSKMPIATPLYERKLEVWRQL